MVFNSYTFAIFFLLVLVVYYTIKDVSNINNQFSYPSSFLKHISDSTQTNYSLITNTYSSIPVPVPVISPVKEIV
jgi:hypothetical protein